MPALADAFRHPPLAQAFGDPALLAGMLRFEAALAYAQADAGIVPRAAAATIERVCDTLAAPAALDVAQLAADARRAGTLAIPLVKALTAAVAAQDPAAARHVHIGATSQDLLDTALALAQRDAARMLLSMLEPLGDSLAQLARQHRHTMMNGRTLLQAATPVPFGWKAAGWLDPLTRSRVSLAAASDAAAVLQFGGAAGTLAALGEHGTAVAAGLARRLELAQPQIAWHGARDRVARLAAELATVCGAAAKIGRDIALLMQPEVGEAFEPDAPGRGGSSALPHKRNPVAAMLALEAAQRAPALAATLIAALPSDHERGLGNWQGNWWTLGALYDAAGSAIGAIGEALAGLRVDADAMRANLERMQGFVFAEAVTVALSDSLGRPAAQALVERICRRAFDERRGLRDALADDAQAAARLDPQALERLFDPASQTGSASAMIDAVLARWESPAPHSG